MAGRTIRELLVSLKVNSKGGMDNLARFGLAVNGVKAGLQILSDVARKATDATFGFIKEQTAQADAIAKGARAAGLGSREYQRLAFAMDRSGVPMKNFIKGSQNMARNMRDAALGGGKAFTQSLDEIGLSMKDLIGLSFEEKIGLIGERLKTLPTLAMRVAAAQKLIGEEAGPKFASALMEGRAGLKALGDEAEALGLVMSDDALGAAESYQDALTNLDTVITGLKRTIALEAAPQFKAIIDRFREWLKVNRQLVRAKIGDVLSQISKIVMSVVENFDDWVKAFKDIVEVAMKFVNIVLDLTKAVGGAEVVVKAATVALAGFAAAQAAALGPIGLTVAALAGLAVAFGDIETNADRARIAQERFGEGGFGKSKTSDEIQELSDRLHAATIGNIASKSSPLPGDLAVDLAHTNVEDLLKIFRTAKGSAGRTFGGGFDADIAELQKSNLALSERQVLRVHNTIKKARESQSRERPSSASASTNESEHFARLKAIGDTKGDSTLSEAEVLKLIDIAADEGKSLTGLLGGRKIEGGVPPVISVRVNNNQFNTTVNGADSRTVEQLADMVMESQQEMLREAGEAMSPVFVR